MYVYQAKDHIYIYIYIYIYKYVEESYFHRCNNTYGVGTAIFYNYHWLTEHQAKGDFNIYWHLSEMI